MNPIIFDIERNSYVDGPGIRTTVFFKGCNLKCAWCHNPESQSPTPEMMFYQDKCSGCGNCKKMCPSPQNCTLCGTCADYCPMDARRVCGRAYSPEEVLKEILKDKDYYENSGGGVTFSGGECMLQITPLLFLLKLCKENNIHTAVDTAGHIPFENFEKILPFTDLILYDIKLFDSKKHKQYVGADNHLILENLKKLFQKGIPIRIRIPIISGVNDSEEELQSIKDFIDAWGKPEKIELLPYHAMGENKYRAIGRQAITFAVPSEEKMLRLKNIFSK